MTEIIGANVIDDLRNESIEESTNVVDSNETILPTDTPENIEEVIPPNIDTSDTGLEDENIEDLSSIDQEFNDEELDALSDEELDALLEGLEGGDEQIEVGEEREEVYNEVDDNELSISLKEKDAAIKALTSKMDSYIKENANLKVQNAEFEMYDEKNPLEMIAVKARAGDDQAKADIIALADEFRTKDSIINEVDSASQASSIKGGTSVLGNIQADELDVTVL